MWLYYLLKTMSTVISWLPYKAVVVIGKGMGHLYHKIAKKQRVRAEETIRERLGYSQEQAEATIAVCEAWHNLYGNYVYAGVEQGQYPRSGNL